VHRGFGGRCSLKVERSSTGNSRPTRKDITTRGSRHS
jgi:hypothetical protein